MLTEPSFINMIHVLDKRAKGGKNYGFRQTIWAEIADELEFLNEVLTYIGKEDPNLIYDASEAVEKARAK
jgi:hypothetical protein